MSRRKSARGSSQGILLLTAALTAVGCARNAEPKAPEPPREADLQHSRQMEEELAKSGARIRDLEKEVAGLQGELRDAQESVRQAQARRSAQAQLRQPDPALTYSVAVDGDPAIGRADAKVTMVVGYEYACLYCNKARAVTAELIKKYGADLRVVYKSFIVHPQKAMAPALAACAGHKQGRFAQLDKLLWEKAFEVDRFDVGLCWESEEGCPLALELGKEAGLNLIKMKADMKSCLADQKADQVGLAAHGMEATPGFFINGRWIQGAQQFERFAALIDEELTKATQRLKPTPRGKYYQTWVVERGIDAKKVAAAAAEAAEVASNEIATYAGDIPGTGALFTAIETSMGTFNCELFPDRAPNAVANFVGLATGKKPWFDGSKKQSGKPFYDGLIFHRVIPGFMIQGGDPLGNGTGGPGFHFANETARTPGHVAGALAMANAGPDTNGSQFYITEVAAPQLDRGFTVFGHCREPQLVAKIAAVPRDGRDKPNTPVTIKRITFSRR